MFPSSASNTVETAYPGGQRVNTMDKRTRKPDPQDDPQIRHELVERVRREIAAGTYETPEKWRIAINRLQQRLEEE